MAHSWYWSEGYTVGHGAASRGMPLTSAIATAKSKIDPAVRKLRGTIAAAGGNHPHVKATEPVKMRKDYMNGVRAGYKRGAKDMQSRKSNPSPAAKPPITRTWKPVLIRTNAVGQVQIAPQATVRVKAKAVQARVNPRTKYPVLVEVGRRAYWLVAPKTYQATTDASVKPKGKAGYHSLVALKQLKGEKANPKRACTTRKTGRRNPAAKIPGIADWSMHAGGMSAPADKHGYTYTAKRHGDGNSNYTKYSIDPIGYASNNNKLKHYALMVWSPLVGGYKQLGTFPRAAQAVTKARAHWASIQDK